MPEFVTKLVHRFSARLPQTFRVLHQQFLLRVIDLEAVSLEADIPQFLGQFAGVLIMISLLHFLGVMFFPSPPSMLWNMEEARISDLLLVIGLSAVIMWDTTFPDKRDVMVLAPLPVAPRLILFAKIAASATVLCIAIAALNCASGFGMSVIYGTPSGGLLGLLRFLVAYWLTMIAAAAFLYGSVLTIQGFTALVLPRRMFLRISAILQLAAFGFFLAVRFLQPSLTTHSELIDPANHWLLADSPTFWFLGLFNQLNGTFPADLLWLAHRAWFALAIALSGAAASLLLCYFRTMKKTIEDPDLVPGTGGFHWIRGHGNSLQSAIASFALRSITRSRQHRVVLAFYWSIVFAIALSWIRREVSNPPEPISDGFLISTLLMMLFAVLGLRGVFSLPVSLNANWVLRVTQIRPTRKYIAGTRRCLFLFGVVPIWLISAALSFHLRPFRSSAEHLVFLALFGLVLTEMSLVHFDKVPFTCSYLPGKANIQVIFWGFAVVFLILGMLVAAFEMDAFVNPRRYLVLIGSSMAAAIILRTYNLLHSDSAVLYFEEQPPEVITRLGLMVVPPPRIAATPKSGRL